jgi:hypothetical protein
MKTLDEINKTPVLLLTEEEIDRFPEEKDRIWARACQLKAAREKACTKHEPVGTSTMSGYHSYRCKHCGKDMSWDSGD